jgi:hypothetical protein
MAGSVYMPESGHHASPECHCRHQNKCCVKHIADLESGDLLAQLLHLRIALAQLHAQLLRARLRPLAVA